MSQLSQFIDRVIDYYALKEWIALKGYCRISASVKGANVKHIILSRSNGRPVAIFDVELDTDQEPLQAIGTINGVDFIYPFVRMKILPLNQRKCGENRTFDRTIER